MNAALPRLRTAGSESLTARFGAFNSWAFWEITARSGSRDSLSRNRRRSESHRSHYANRPWNYDPHSRRPTIVFVALSRFTESHFPLDHPSAVVPVLLAIPDKALARMDTAVSTKPKTVLSQLTREVRRSPVISIVLTMCHL